MYDVGQNEFHSHDSIMMVMMMMMMMMVVVMMMMMMMMMMMRWDSIWSDAVLKQKVRCRGCLGFSKATWNLPNDLLLLRPLDLLLSSNHGENGGTLGVDHWRGSHSKETHPFSPLVCSKPKRKNPWGSMDFFMPPDLSNGPTVGNRSDSDAMFLECEFARGSTSWSLGNTAIRSLGVSSTWHFWWAKPETIEMN